MFCQFYRWGAGLFFLGFFLLGFLTATDGVNAQSGVFNLKADVQSCEFLKNVDGARFTVNVDIRNSGGTINEPLVVWVMFDGRICDKKALDRQIDTDESLFDYQQDGRVFSCQVDGDENARREERKGKTFHILYTNGNDDPKSSGIPFFEGNTWETCGEDVNNL